jgi:hypothetical protein
MEQNQDRDWRVAGVLGMLVGSGAMALGTRSFRWKASVEDLVNHTSAC